MNHPWHRFIVLAGCALAFLVMPPSTDARKAAIPRPVKPVKHAAPVKHHQAVHQKQSVTVFQVPASCLIKTPAKQHASLSDLAVGQEVRVRYRQQNGALVADRIVEGNPQHAKKAKIAKHSSSSKTGKHAKKKSAKSTEPKVHGKIARITGHTLAVVVQPRHHKKK